MTRPWLERGRNLLLTLGLLNAYALISVVLVFAVSTLTTNRIVSHLSGEFPWRELLLLRLPVALASVLAAAITGLVASFYLRFSKAWLNVSLVGFLCASANYRGHIWYFSPATWERWLQVGTAVAVGVTMPLVFALARRNAGLNTELPASSFGPEGTIR
jgi:hypothetical protein